jgi:hypothetical protein
MDKASRKAFERQMAVFNAEALAVFGIAQALLSRTDLPSPFGVPTPDAPAPTSLPHRRGRPRKLRA